MNDLIALAQTIIAVTAVAAPMVIAIRLLAGSSAATLSELLVDLLAGPAASGWPQGVQEDEPVRYRLDSRPTGSAA